MVDRFMPFAEPFTILQSPTVTVRVEPPDVVVVEGLPTGTLRFAPSHVHDCSPMLVSWYRDHHDPTYAAPDDDAIVVLLRIEGTFDGLLGPFLHSDGMALANAINLARTHLLFAAPRLSVHVARDSARLLVDCVVNRLRLTIPVPTAQLVDCSVRGDPTIHARYVILSGLTPTGELGWVVFLFARGEPYLLGPLAAHDAEVIAQAVRAWRTTTPRDAEPTEVAECDLVAEPARWHLRRIRVTGEWNYGFEHSAFAGAWLRPQEGFHCADGTRRVRVVGTWVYPDAHAERGFGHMGMWPGALEAESIEVLEE